MAAFTYRRPIWSVFSTLLVVFAIPIACFSAQTDGALRVEIICAYNFVVDSNAGTPSSHAPKSAYVGAVFHNDGSVALTDLIARIGNYNGGVNSTPGIYPQRVQSGLTGPLNGGAFALTHEGGSAGLADATRYIASIPAGGSVAVYWLVGYPQLDVNGIPTWGTSVKPDDDLWLQYDVWATAKAESSTCAVDVTRTVTMRNEISAEANKIYPNGANKVPEYYKELLNQYVPSWTNAYNDGSVGTIISTEGIWYDLGNVGEGFDNNGDMVPDHNAWMQPVGDPSVFDAGAFRLVNTYAMVVVKLKTGGEQVLTGQNQLYFENIPENNGAVGYVHYEFMPLLSGAYSMTSPYQEVASGRDNEKFNADYGVVLGGALVSGSAKVLIDKTASVTTVSPGGAVSYKVAYTNAGSASAGDASAGVPLVVQDTIPTGTVYVAGSATSGNTLPAGVGGYHVLYSTDGGATWTTTEPSPASSVTDIQWWLDGSLAASAAGSIRFSVTVNNPYLVSNPLISNTAGASFGNDAPFATDSATTLVMGNNSVGDTVYADTGVGTGGYLGNGIQDGSEPGLSGVTVWLYADVNANGVLDSGEPLLATAETGSGGAYLFSGLSDGKYVVVVDTADTNLTANGYTVTTVSRYSVDLDSARTNANAVSVLTADFGFAPALVLSKTHVGSGTVREGQSITYSLSVTNMLAGSGIATPQPAVYTVWPTNGTAGTGTKSWTNPSYVWTLGQPDGQYAVAPYDNAGEWIHPSGYFYGAQQGSITNVALVLPLQIPSVFQDASTLIVDVYSNTTAISTHTYVCNTLSNGTLIIDITSAKTAWRWTDFDGTMLSVKLTSSKASQPRATLGVDSVGFRLTTDQSVGGLSATTTLDPVPLNDTYDVSRLKYVSASASPDSVTTNGGTGTIHWDNIGPLYAGGGCTVSVIFKVLQPPNNRATILTNSASVTSAAFLNGLPANQGYAQVTNTVQPAGTIGDTVWRDLNGDGIQSGTNETGVAGVTVNLYTNSTVLVASTVTDASGHYLFEGIAVSNSYTVTVVASTLPGGLGTCTKDRDATANGTTTFVLDVGSTTGGDTVLDADFGYNGVQSIIRGTLWDDDNRDGSSAPESGEELFSGVTVRLYASDGTTLLATTNTASDGTYRFVGSYSGSYVVKADTTTGALAVNSWTRSYDTDGTNTANQVTVSVVSGGQAIADFSYYQNGVSAVGDTLFYDWNGNGAQDSGTDGGIANVTVRLYQDENTNGVVDAGVDAMVGETVTSANGTYLFAGLPAGTYLVVVDQSDTNLATRFINTYDPYGAKDGRSVVTLGTATTNLLQDFGYQPYGFNSIGDTVWYDANADGVQSGATEAGLSNVTVRLYADLSGSGSYSLVRTTTTGTAGYYLFDSLPDGNYRVVVDTGSAGLPTDTFGVAYRPTTVTLYSVSVSGGQSYLNSDFGFAPLGAIGDTIFWDNNASGGQDWNEPGISNVTVKLYRDLNANGVFDSGETLVATAVTDASGKYLFSGLSQGNYVVVVDSSSAPLANATLRADPEMDGEPCPVPPVAGETCDGETGVSILPGTSFMGADFGYQPPGVIGDLVWIDQNTNGVFDAGEQGIPYVTVALYSGSTLVATNVTDADGYYSFGNLTDGVYRVQVLTSGTNFPSSLTATYDADGTADSVANAIVISGDHVTSIGGNTVTNADLTIDFGYRYAGDNSLSGTVGLDAPTYDGLMNGTNPHGEGAGEYPFVGSTVYLYLWHDADANNVIGAGEGTLIASTLTATNGDYSFGSLPSGVSGDRYVVSMAAPASDLKLTTQTGSSASVLWVVNTTNVLGMTAAAYQVVPIVTSSENVDFAFKTTQLLDFGDLPESYSTVLGDQPAGASHTIVSNLYLGNGVSGELNGKPSATASGDDYDDGVSVVGDWKDGVAGGTVQVNVGAGSGWLEAWIDFNKDGTFTNANEHVISQAVSHTENGGVYSLSFDIPSGTFITNGTTVLNARFRLYASQPEIPTYFGSAVGGEVEDYQFTFGIIGDRVWNDTNGNGIQDGGEPGVSNITIRLYNEAQTLLASTNSDANGNYAFVGLQTNVGYNVTFVQPTGTLFTVESAGSDATVDSDVNSNGTSISISLTPLADRRDIDAGLHVSSLSTAMDISAYASGDGSVVLEVWTSDENGYGDIVVYAWINNAWVEVGRVPSDQVIGEGSNKYVIQAQGLTVGTAYSFKIVDESGHIHYSVSPVTVESIRMDAVRLDMDTFIFSVNTQYERRYEVLMSTNLSASASEWAVEYASVKTNGAWTAYSNKPFTARAGNSTTVRVPVNLRKAFFKIVLMND